MSAPRKFAPWAGRLVTILTACAIFLGIFVRVYAPGAPSPLWFYTYNTDEGHYSYCAHNMLNEGRFFVNDAKYSLATPLFCLLQYVFAAPWNATWGIARYRFVSIAAGLVLCVILGYFFPRGRLRWSVVALSLLSFMGVVHSRYAIPDTLLAMMMTACAWLALRGSEPAAR
ncbi:hypothetical protein EG835_05430, partial [bacterium]|nr:hypothetical protein [bacterium]